MTGSVTGGGPRTDGVRPAARQGHLAGPSRPLDRRINAVRDDLADAALAGIVTAPRYVEGVYRRGAVPATTLRAAPNDDAVAVSELLFGEVFVVFDLVGGDGGWAWGQGLDDRYVGWVRQGALGPVGAAASHRVAVPAAPVFAAADIKARVMTTLPLGARLAATAAGENFVAAAGGFVHRRHVALLADVVTDPVALAAGFTGTPYVWGGRTRAGIDCSGLTQAVLAACGIACPRDADQQAAAFGAVDPADRRRGDLAVFPGHVGLLVDRDTLFHSTAHSMTTLAEPLATVAGRVSPTGFHRPPPPAATPC